MDITSMVAAQQQWIDKIAAQIASGEGADKGGTLPAEILSGNIEAARGRIERLTLQREELARRLDAALAEEQSALKLMEQQVGDTAPTPKATRRPASAGKRTAIT